MTRHESYSNERSVSELHQIFLIKWDRCLFTSNPLSANPTKWSNNLPTNCLSVFDHSVILALKSLRNNIACCSFKFWDSLLIEVTKM